MASDLWIPDVARPAIDLYGRPPYGVTMTSFGCPLSCKYCASPFLWFRYRRKDPSEVLDEIDFQITLGVKDIAFTMMLCCLMRRTAFIRYAKK